jgi:hypothetical protein
MKLRWILLLLALAVPCAAKEVTVGGRVRFSYDASRWQSLPVAILGASVTRIADDEGDFMVLVMAEKSIAGGMASAKSRREFIEGLADVDVKTEDVKPIDIFGKSGFEFVGKREVAGGTLRIRIILLIDDQEVLIVVSSAPRIDPMSSKSISTVWKTIEILGGA